MENFRLQPNESLLYKGKAHCTYKNERFLESLSTTTSTELILTNLNLVFIKKTKKFFEKEQVDVDAYPVDNIKVYNEVPQIKQDDSSVEIFLTSGEKILHFYDKQEARKFINAAYELLTGKSLSVRNAEKVKSAVNLVDETLGINTVNTVKNVIGNGITGTIIGGVGKKVLDSSKGSGIIKDALSITKDIMGKNSTAEIAKDSQTKALISYDEQLETIKKLKDMLDTGILTQEEFDAKKREILGL